MNKQYNPIKRKVLVKSSMLLFSAFFLVGCDSFGNTYDDFIQNSASEIEQSSQLTQIRSDELVESEVEAGVDEFVDTRLVPEQSMVESALLSREDISFGEPIFSIQERFVQKQQTFEVSIDSFQMFAVEDYDATLENEFNFDNNDASIILMHATITNTSNETFYFPIEELRLSYPSATIHTYPSAALYPMESGNLADILLANSGEMAPQTAVEGFLVYGVGGEATKDIMDLESFYLTVVPPRQNLSQIVGLGSNPLGEELPLYLPTTGETAEQLLLNMTYIQDRITTEMWGTKEIVAAQQLDKTERIDEGISVTLKRIEVSEFEPDEEYEEAFQYFMYGQMIVSIEYEVANESDYDILPIDGSASLVINGDEIRDDYILINELYGKSLKPGQSYTVVKSFALDKMSYAENWQGNDYYISVTIPIDDTSADSRLEASDLIKEDEDPTLEADEASDFMETALTEFFFEFTWTPELTAFIDDEMNLISQEEWQKIQATNEESSEEETPDESIESSEEE